jgi:hypothetical protein
VYFGEVNVTKSLNSIHNTYILVLMIVSQIVCILFGPHWQAIKELEMIKKEPKMI